ncbi:DUF1109 domain-containing protein [Paraburkholderia diazotrophica]|uniref:DUF1109 domain-containing protein n=1 Tax=Paraburkholderia diazotrophica TaxID=667676 RepID=UPI00316E3D77
MKTEEFIVMLADGPRAPSRSAVACRLGGGVAFSVVAALLMLAFVVPGGIPVQALIARLALTMFWLKVALPLSIAIAAVCVASRLSQPGVRVGRAWHGLLAPFIVVWLVALATLVATSADSRGALILGHTWRTCSLNIALLSIPALFTLLRAMRRLAPTRPALAGAATGLLAGAIGALTYCLRCPEMEAPFWATWYLLGMSAPTLAGALLGRRLMRW